MIKSGSLQLLNLEPKPYFIAKIFTDFRKSSVGTRGTPTAVRIMNSSRSIIPNCVTYGLNDLCVSTGTISIGIDNWHIGAISFC